MFFFWDIESSDIRMAKYVSCCLIRALKLRVKSFCLLVMSTSELRMLRMSAMSVGTWDGKSVVLSRTDSYRGGAGALTYCEEGGDGPCLAVSREDVACELAFEALNKSRPRDLCDLYQLIERKVIDLVTRVRERSLMDQVSKC